MSERPIEVSSERLLLRPYRPGDGRLYIEMYRANRAHLFEFMPEELQGMATEADAELHIQRLLRGWQERELFVFGAWEQATGGYVGEAYLANPDWHVPSLEVGYFVVAGQTGRGFATEAGVAVVDVAFEHFGVARVDLQCRADNLASAQVAGRLGFQFEGRQRQRQRKRSGGLVDRLWYGLLRGVGGPAKVTAGSVEALNLHVTAQVRAGASMRRLILAGGGDAVASRPLDAHLAAWLPPARPLLYLPVAMNGVEPSYDACLAWVTSVFAPLGVADIVMWTDLAGKMVDDLRPFGAVYIGGGNAFRLLHVLRATGADLALAAYIADGGIVYGGSAGAIVLGADITTAAHADPNTVGLQDTRGLDVVDGCSIWCHYDPTQAVQVETYARDRAHPVIALPEDAGIVVEDTTISAMGAAPVVVFDGTARVTVTPSSIVTLPRPRAFEP